MSNTRTTRWRALTTGVVAAVGLALAGCSTAAPADTTAAAPPSE